MRAWVVALALVGCGRIGFNELDRTDAIDANDTGDATIAIDRFTRVVAFSGQTCGIHRGALYCWGYNANGELGDSSLIDRARPSRVALPPGRLADVAVGDGLGLAIVDGVLYQWGNGTPDPAIVPLAAQATAVTAGTLFACAIADGMYCWGENGRGQLGINSTTFRPSPQPVTLPSGPVALDAGDDHVCALVAGEAHCWGHNDGGSLGDGTEIERHLPVRVMNGIASLPQLAGWHACAIVNRDVWCWGSGDSGQLGTDVSVDTHFPFALTTIHDVDVIATGGGPADRDATCAISSGDVWCWGMGLHGRLGNGGTLPSGTPAKVAGLPGPALGVALGYNHTCAVLADGDIWCWGYGLAGQLGDDTGVSSLTPVRVLRPDE